MKITPDQNFRLHIVKALELNVEAEVKDYLNRTWLDDPNREDWDTTDFEEELLAFCIDNLQIQFVYD